MVALPLCLAAQIAVAADWQDVATDSAGNRCVFDRQSVVHGGSTVRAAVCDSTR